MCGFAGDDGWVDVFTEAVSSPEENRMACYQVNRASQRFNTGRYLLAMEQCDCAHEVYGDLPQLIVLIVVALITVERSLEYLKDREKDRAVKITSQTSPSS